jgi:hypothetical protein
LEGWHAWVVPRRKNSHTSPPTPPSTPPCTIRIAGGAPAARPRHSRAAPRAPRKPARARCATPPRPIPLGSPPPPARSRPQDRAAAAGSPVPNGRPLKRSARTTAAEVKHGTPVPVVAVPAAAAAAARTTLAPSGAPHAARASGHSAAAAPPSVRVMRWGSEAARAGAGRGGGSPERDVLYCAGRWKSLRKWCSMGPERRRATDGRARGGGWGCWRSAVGRGPASAEHVQELAWLRARSRCPKAAASRGDGWCRTARTRRTSRAQKPAVVV